MSSNPLSTPAGTDGEKVDPPPVKPVPKTIIEEEGHNIGENNQCSYEIDHDYLYLPSNKIPRGIKRKNDDNLNVTYKETIESLRSIENTVGNRIECLENTIAGRLDSLETTVANGLASLNRTLQEFFCHFQNQT